MAESPVFWTGAVETSDVEVMYIYQSTTFSGVNTYV